MLIHSSDQMDGWVNLNSTIFQKINLSKIFFTETTFPSSFSSYYENIHQYFLRLFLYLIKGYFKSFLKVKKVVCSKKFCLEIYLISISRKEF